MMLRGLGFSNDTSIYLASGKIYQAERHLAPLLKMFPYLYTKESLATPDELAPFKVTWKIINTIKSQILIYMMVVIFFREKIVAMTNYYWKSFSNVMAVICIMS